MSGLMGEVEKQLFMEQLGSKLAEREELKQTADYIKKQLDEIDEFIKENISLNAPVECGDFRIVYSTAVRKSVDTTQLKMDMPDTYAKYERATSYTTLKITKRK